MDIDILWIDTVHIYDQVAAEFKVYEPLLADEALVVLDDININDMRRFFDEVTYEKFDLTATCHKSGFGAFIFLRPNAQRGRSSQERLLEAFMRSNRVGFQRNAHLRRQLEQKARRFSFSGLFR